MFSSKILRRGIREDISDFILDRLLPFPTLNLCHLTPILTYFTTWDGFAVQKSHRIQSQILRNIQKYNRLWILLFFCRIKFPSVYPAFLNHIWIIPERYTNGVWLTGIGSCWLIFEKPTKNRRGGDRESQRTPRDPNRFFLILWN